MLVVVILTPHMFVTVLLSLITCKKLWSLFCLLERKGPVFNRNLANWLWLGLFFSTLVTQCWLTGFCTLHLFPQGYHHLPHGEPMDRLSSLPPMTSFRQSAMHHGQSSPYLHSSVSPPLNGSDPMGMIFTLKPFQCLKKTIEIGYLDIVLSA